MKLYVVVAGEGPHGYGTPRLVTDDESKALVFADVAEEQQGHSDIMVYELDQEY